MPGMRWFLTVSMHPARSLDICVFGRLLADLCPPTTALLDHHKSSAQPSLIEECLMRAGVTTHEKPAMGSALATAKLKEALAAAWHWAAGGLREVGAHEGEGQPTRAGTKHV